MYVDDLMKSKSTSEEAIVLVSQLRELLARGGFRLTTAMKEKYWPRSQNLKGKISCEFRLRKTAD